MKLSYYEFQNGILKLIYYEEYLNGDSNSEKVIRLFTKFPGSRLRDIK